MGAPKPKRVGVCPWNKPRSTARRMESAAQWLSGTSEKPVEAAAAGAGSAAVTSRAQSSAQEQNHCSRLFMLSFFAPLASDFFQILAEMPDSPSVGMPLYQNLPPPSNERCRNAEKPLRFTPCLL